MLKMFSKQRGTLMSPISRAVEIAGGQASLAKLVDKSASFINQLVTGRRPVPPALCSAIERAVGGQVTRKELRPDIFGEEAAAGGT